MPGIAQLLRAVVFYDKGRCWQNWLKAKDKPQLSKKGSSQAMPVSQSGGDWCRPIQQSAMGKFFGENPSEALGLVCTVATFIPDLQKAFLSLI